MALDTLTLDSTTQLKKVTDELAYASVAKCDHDQHVAKLTEDLAGSNKEVMALKEQAQKGEAALNEVRSQLSSKSQDLDTANNTITDMRARLGTLVSEIKSAAVREKLPMKDLDNARTLQKDAEDKLVNQIEQRDLWIKNLVDIAERLTTQITTMDMKSWDFSVGRHEVPIVKLTLYFEGLIKGLKM